MARPYATFVVVSYLLSFTTGHAAFGQCGVHEAAKLTASDAAKINYFGTSVSVSGDVAVVGAHYQGCELGFNCGAAYVYKLDGALWIQQAKLTASDAARFLGSSVSISGDTIVVGDAFDHCAAGSDCGSAYVFVKPAGGWSDMTQTAKLTASDAADGDYLGVAVSISDDTIVVGAPGDAHDHCGPVGACGSAYVFVKPVGGWSDQTESAKLTASDADIVDELGIAVSISGDTIVAGASYDNCAAGIDCGSAYVFVKPGGGWSGMTQTAKLTAADAAKEDVFGVSVSISEDTIVVGAPGADSLAAGIECGSAYVFVKPGGGWSDMTQTAKLTASDATWLDGLGLSVSIRGDTIVVGAGGDDCGAGIDCGSAYVFVKPGGGWSSMTQTAKLTASDVATEDFFGFSVSVSGDVAVVGARNSDCAAGIDCGSAYIYALPAVDAPPCPQPDPSGIAKNRSLAFSLPSPVTAGPGVPTALRVRLVDLQTPDPSNAVCCPPPDFSAYESATCTAAGEANGCVRWAGKPGTFLESQGNSGAGNYRAARLQCTPFYHDWSGEGLIHVVGAEVVPSSTYEVENLAESCIGIEDTCTALSMPLTIRSARSGDVAAPYNPPGTTTQPDAIDVTQLVNKFKNLPGAPIKPIAQLQPNLPELNADINALDVVAVVDAFKGSAYPFSGPCPCPSTVVCNTVECPSGPAACVTAFGAGAMCVKTCDTGDNAGEPCINNGHCPGGGTCGNVFCRDRCGRCTP
jgi:hypothetical protein